MYVCRRASTAKKDPPWPYDDEDKNIHVCIYDKLTYIYIYMTMRTHV